jgi:hypothetical protein
MSTTSGPIKSEVSVEAPILKGALDGTIKVPSYAFASLPAAASNSGVIVYTTNGVAGAAGLLRSDGTNWKVIATQGANAATS